MLANPVVYVSEGVRAALTPEVPHMPPMAFLFAMTLMLLLLGGAGLRFFLRRVTS